MKKIQRIISLLLVIVSVFTITCVGASAKTRYNLKTSFSSYTSVSFINKRSCAYINVYNIDGIYNKNNTHYLKLTDGNGRYVWQGSVGSNASCRMYLGNDHSSYRLYVRSAHSSGSVSVSAAGNCRVS